MGRFQENAWIDEIDKARPYLLSIAEIQLKSYSRRSTSASDVVQTAIVRGLQGLDSFRGQTPEEFRGWLRAILLNCVADVQRRETRTVLPLDEFLPIDEPSPSSIVSQLDQSDQLRAAIARLEEPARRILRLRYVEGLAWDAVASQMGSTVGSVRSIWSRAVVRLRHELDHSHVP